MLDKIRDILADAQKIVVLQADNPDADSIGSALALEAILSEQGKSVYLYCAVDMPDYLKYLEGWSRIHRELPSSFDASIVVDASTRSLFEKDPQVMSWMATKACIVLDHHAQTSNDIDFAVVVNEHSTSSTCEVVWNLCKQLDWIIPDDAMPYLLTGILGDTQGLSNQLATASTYRAVGDMVERGVDRPALEELRRAASKMTESIYRYKAKLIDRTETHIDGKLALVSIPQDEINTYSPLYNPGPLIQPDMLQVEGVAVSVVFKIYADGKITGTIRCNPGAAIADKLAVHFGGGGHAYASGFKLTDGRPYNEVKSECISVVTELLAKLEQEHTHETPQHTQS